MLAELFPELVSHLVEAGRVSRAVDLFADPEWVKRRAGQAGPGSVSSDERIVLSAALGGHQDSQAVRLLILSDGIRERFRRAWAGGGAARRIAAAQSSGEAASVARSLGDDAAPWADFLAAARAVQLGATEAARRILEGVSARAWPRYRYPATSYGLRAFEGSEAAVWVYCFCQVFPASPESVARLALRLCAESGRDGVPSRYTVWAELLDRLAGEKKSPALIVRAVELAHEAILPGAVPFGYEQIYSSRLKAIEAIAAHVSPMWLSGQLAITLETFRQWSFSGPGDDGAYRAVTPLIEHFVVLAPLLRDPELASVVRRTRDVLEEVSFVPPAPTSHSYGDRSYLWARYARALEALNSPKAGQAAAAALRACEMDGACDDPPRRWVGKALALLEASGDEAVSRHAKSLRERLEPPAPGEPPGPWSPGRDAKDPFEIGLYELARDAGDRPSEAGRPMTEGTGVGDAIRLAIMAAWLRAPDADALTCFMRHAARLSAGFSKAWETSRPVVILKRAAALERRGMVSDALAALTGGLDLCLREGGDMEGAVHIVARLALHDRCTAWEALQRLGLDDPIDVGSAVAAVLVTLIGEGGADDDVEWWLGRLPAHAGPLCCDEDFLLAAGGGDRRLAPALEPIAGRVLDQLETALDELRRSSAGGEETAEWRDRLEYTAAFAATFAAFGFAEEREEGRFSGVLDALEDLAGQSKPHGDVIGALLRALAGSNVRSPAAAERYLRWLANRVAAPSIASRFFDAERLVKAAIALREARPAEARDLVAEAFDRLRREPAEPGDGSSGLMARMASVITDLLAGAATGESTRQTDSRRFADAVVSWAAWAGGDTAARQLEEIAARSDDEEARSRLLAGAAKAYFAAGCPDDGSRCLAPVPETVLGGMEVLEGLGGTRISAAQRRAVLSSLLAGGLRAREPLAAALGMLFGDAVDGSAAEECAGYLRGLETSLEDAVRTVSIQAADPL